MKQILENLRTGDIYVAEVPAPQVRRGSLLIRNHYSVISSGTEGATIQLGKMSLLGKARARPEQVRKVINVVRTQGLLPAYLAASRSLDMPIPLGYSCAGEVIAVGEGVLDFSIGDRVACGGAPYAYHAEQVCVPKNLCVPVPDGVDLKHAAIASIGAIALNALRVGDVRLGERVVIVGLGLLGLIAAQLARAAGCEVLGVDLDPARVDFFRDHQYGEAYVSNLEGIATSVSSWSKGVGADLVIITASSPGNEPVAMAGEFVRRRGRVVVVGRTEMKAPRETYLFKEVKLLTSFSCGPGADDPQYEWAGADYPLDLVRWSERRNIEAFISLLAEGRLRPEDLISREFPAEQAVDAFNSISNSGPKAVAIALRYSIKPELQPDPMPARAAVVGRLSDRVRVGVLGAGSHATNEVVPLLAKFSEVSLRGIASAGGIRASALASKYGFSYAASDPEEIINDPNTDAVVILTRHDSHADLAARALRAGKHVLVEKPLALNHKQISQVEAALKEGQGSVMVGFNRRFAPLAKDLAKLFDQRSQPMSVFYRANVGYRPPNHWLHHAEQGGGVLLGEACHFIDFCCWLIDAPIADFDVSILRGQAPALISEDNLQIKLSFRDGSVATILYLSNGSPAIGREYIEVFCEQKSAVLWDFRRLEYSLGPAGRLRSKKRLMADMGHSAQMQNFLDRITGRRKVIEGGFSDLESSRITVKLNELMRASETAAINAGEEEGDG